MNENNEFKSNNIHVPKPSQFSNEIMLGAKGNRFRNIGQIVEIALADSEVFEIPLVDPVGKGIWKTLNYEQKTVHIQDQNVNLPEVD